MSQQPARGRFTYGFGRSTQIASVLNGLLIFAAGVFVVWEGVERLQRPVELPAVQSVEKLHGWSLST